MTMNATGTLLYVVEDQSDTVDVIDTTDNEIIETSRCWPTRRSCRLSWRNMQAPTRQCTLSPDEKTLYVTMGNLNPSP